MALSGAGFAKGEVANLNLAYGAECGVDAMAPSPAGFRDVAGNLWQVRHGRSRGCCGVPGCAARPRAVQGSPSCPRHTSCLAAAPAPAPPRPCNPPPLQPPPHLHPPLPPPQWCEDNIASLPESLGPHPYYDDFTSPCYDGGRCRRGRGSRRRPAAGCRSAWLAPSAPSPPQPLLCIPTAQASTMRSWAARLPPAMSGLSSTE